MFNTFWEGERFSPLEQACMRSFAREDGLLHVFAYSRPEVPAGVIVEDATDILPHHQFFTFEQSPSAFSNIFRYKLLYERGGWWVDTDVLHGEHKTPDCDYYWALEVPGQINGAVLKFPPGDAMCWRLLRLSEERSKNLTHWGQLGPDLLSKVLANFRPPRLCGSTSDVYPLHWFETHFLWLPEFRGEVEQRIQNSTFVHLWQSMFRRMRIDLNIRPPSGSYLHELYKRYGVKSRGHVDLSADRQLILAYLELEYVRKHWVNELGRDIECLYPSDEIP